MTGRIRLFLSVEAAAFALAALTHAGILASGYEHREARIAETAIAAVLAAGLIWTWIAPARARTAGLAAQGFALFWTLVGIFTIVAGVGPRTVPDIVYHTSIVIVLLFGLTVAWRARSVPTGQNGPTAA